MFQQSDFPLRKAVPDSLLITQLMSLQYLEAFLVFLDAKASLEPTPVSRLVGQSFTLSDFHFVGVFGPLQSVRGPQDVIYFLKAMTNRLQFFRAGKTEQIECKFLDIQRFTPLQIFGSKSGLKNPKNGLFKH